MNIVGGCCGTTPDHIRAIAEQVAGVPPRKIPTADGRPSFKSPHTQFAGLEVLAVRPDSNFQMIGERTNVTGSKKFQRLIKDGKFGEAVDVALEQVRGGANLIDVNMDEGLLDSEQAMTHFLNLIATEPEISRLPIMIDSSKWSVLEAGLKCVQGKPVVNSISLKEGEEDFLKKARRVQQFGAGVVVMAFDETGQADTVARKVEICSRAYKLLTEKLDFDPTDIIFDPNILAIATGLEEHNEYAINFIEACRQIKAACPGVNFSGGISNLSFSFRGNDVVREAIHSAFLFHAIKAGLNMGIVNAGQLIVYEDIPKDLLEHVEDIIFNRRPDATERMVQFAETVKGAGDQARDRPEVARQHRRGAPVARARARRARFSRARSRGGAPEVRAAARDYRRPADGRHESGRRSVRRRQDVPAAGRQERARDEEGGRVPDALHGGGKGARAEGGHRHAAQGKILMATVKGDVHDIGKNIVGVVLGCNNYEVIDLGVMVPTDKILQTAIDEKVDMVGLSGLITPSLDEMVFVASEMERRGFTLPLLIGGATTSKQHTAVKIAPAYEQGDRARARRVARGGRGVDAAESGQDRRLRRREQEEAGGDPRAVREPRAASAALLPRRARERAEARMDGRAGAVVHRPPVPGRRAARRRSRSTSTGRCSSRRGS